VDTGVAEPFIIVGFVAVNESKKDCREGRAHSELDGAVSLYSVSSSMLCGRRGGVLLYCNCGFLVFFILDPDIEK